MIIPVIIEKSPDEIKKRIAIAKNFAEMIQIDITDIEYVGTDTYKNLSKIVGMCAPLSVDLDLMVCDPFTYLKDKHPQIKKCLHYVKTGQNLDEFIARSKSFGYITGVGIGPETDLQCIHEKINQIDYVQFYTVKPGAKGRPFEKEVINKIKNFRKTYPKIPIQVDGGINESTLHDLLNIGINDFVAGSSIFNSSNPKQSYISLSNMVNKNETTEINSILDFPGKEIIKQIAILGGAAWTEKDEPYQQAFETSRLLALNGYEVVNGGGPGVMEASTKGAHAGGGDVLAITYYPNKPKRHYEGRALGNNFDTEVKTLDYFDRTKVMLQTTQAHIVFKGSIGTLSEFGMTWISSWIHEPHNKPIILFGEFWNEFITLIEKHMLIVKGEEKMMKICTKPEEVIDYLKSLK